MSAMAISRQTTQNSLEQTLNCPYHLDRDHHQCENDKGSLESLNLAMCSMLLQAVPIARSSISKPNQNTHGESPCCSEQYAPMPKRKPK